MQKRIQILAILLLCAAIGAAGCTGTTGTPAQPTGSPVTTTVQSPANNLVVSPTDVVPENNAVSVIVQEKDYIGNISVVFDGGKGQYLVKSASVTLYRSDGQVVTMPLGIKKGDLVELMGTKQTDRVVAYISEVNGMTYKVADVLSEYRTRNPA